MSEKITIEPVTRIEGHGKVTIHLDDEGKVADARMHVNEFRGFERFCVGRMFFEMPIITQRICGICPISHHLASAKACDAIAGVEPTPTGRALRELMHMGQYIQSHSMHFFHLAGPDLLLGMDAYPAKRNVVGLVEAAPQVALKAVQLRKFGQEIIRMVAGRRIHPIGAVPGGVNSPLAPADREVILGQCDGMASDIQLGIELMRTYCEQHPEEMQEFASFDSAYMGLVNENGGLALYDGKIKIVGAQGETLEPGVDPADYLSIIAEKTEDWSYLKFPYYAPMGFPQGVYRVGPLARLNVANSIDTPLAGEEFKRFKEIGEGKPVRGSLYFHYARLIEALYAVERAKALLEDEVIKGEETVAAFDRLNPEGVGVIEAPRGTLIHHYKVDPTGKLEQVNLIVATGHNNWAMNTAVGAVARKYINGAKLTEGMLNRVEAAIRCYDPCLSCATHALGQMPLQVLLLSASGQVLDEIRRD